MRNENEIVESFKNLIGESNFNVLEFFAGTIGDVAPIISNLMTSFKIYRLKNRLEKHEIKLKELSEKVVVIEDEKFVDILKNFLFPSILQQLLDEDEDNKIGYFLDGFGNVIDSRVIDESEILILYDTLKNLRFIEIEYLISFSRAYKNYHRGKEIKDYFKEDNFSKIKQPIENKLENIGLIDTGKYMTYNETLNKMGQDVLKQKFGGSRLRSNVSPQVEITEFGYLFLNTFSLLDQYMK